ncbi:hypothetical protein [Nocardia sp. NPDC019302]|uniref:hypothetical protein n=1 Tax=Nocardia sp. NPDC019302 TaxID=3154592 RepID=UPI00340849D5
MAWQFVTTTRDVINALLGLEKNMGQVADALTGVKDQLDKAKGEILVKIGELETKLSNAGKLDDADQAAIQALKDAAVDLDNVVPDEPVEQQPAPAETVPAQPEPEPAPVPEEPTEPTA